MIKMFVNLVSKKWKNNNNSTYQISRLQNPLLMIIVDTPGNSLSNIYRKLDMRKVHTPSVKSS